MLAAGKDGLVLSARCLEWNRLDQDGLREVEGTGTRAKYGVTDTGSVNSMPAR